MKSLQDIYDNINKKFYEKTKIDVERGTAIDYFILGSSDMIKDAYDEIELNRTPHIYSSLSGDRLDDAAMLVGLTRHTDESDSNFMYRFLTWNVSNKASNLTAIENALTGLDYSSHVTYKPLAFGCSTAAAYIIPKEMTDIGKELAIAETKDRLSNVISPSTYVEYLVPRVIPFSIVCLIKTRNADKALIKSNIEKKIIEYVNGIAPGEYLEIGTINDIGNDEQNVIYFNVSSVIVDNVEIGEISLLQKVESKFITSADAINWVEVE